MHARMCVCVCVFAHIHICVHHGVPMEVREQISGVFFTLCESHLLLDAGQQSLLQVLLLTELSGHIKLSTTWISSSFLCYSYARD